MPSGAASGSPELSMPRSTSTERSRTEIISPVTGISRARRRSSRFSSAWVKRTRLVRPKEPAPPLMEWAERKMAFRVSISPGAERSASSSVSMEATCSALSCMKVSRKWLRSIFMASERSLLLRSAAGEALAPGGWPAPRRASGSPDWCGSGLGQNFGYGLQQLLRIEGLDDPARGSCRLPLFFFGGQPFGSEHQDGLGLYGRPFAAIFNERDAIH